MFWSCIKTSNVYGKWVISSAGQETVKVSIKN